MDQKIRVLHLDSEKTWRGGENQMALLIEGSQDQVTSFLLCPENSVASKKLKSICTVVTGSFQFPKLISTAKLAKKLIEKEGIQFIDCQSSKAHNLGLLIKLFCPNIKLIVHRRVDFVPGKSFFNRKKYLSPKVDRYIPISKAISQVLLDYGIAKEKITTIHSATDDQHYKHLSSEESRLSLCKELSLDPDKKILLNVAYHTPQKGIPTLIKTLAMLKTRGEKVICLLAGDGELHEEMKQLATQLGLKDNEIRFLGIRKDIPRLMCGADIFVFPSNYEGLGTSLLDAIHGGCAVVASRVGGIPEIIIHGRTGLLCEVGQSAELASHIQRLLKDPYLSQELVKNAKKHVKDGFSVTNMVSKNLAVYHSLL